MQNANEHRKYANKNRETNVMKMGINDICYARMLNSGHKREWAR